MDQSTGDVQQNRERARASITEKIELLEESVRDRVADAKTAVKQTFDLRYHVNRRPWQMFGLSVVTGYFVGRLVSDRSSGWQGRRARKDSRSQLEATQQIGLADTSTVPSEVADDLYTPPTSRRGQKRSWGILDQFHDEIETLKGAAIAAVVSVVRDLIKSATDSIKDSAKSLGDSSRSSTERGQAGRI